MTETVVELHPAFRKLCVQVREYRRVIAFSVDRFDYDISMVESGRMGALHFVVLFTPRDGDAQANEVRIVFAAVGDDKASIKVRGPGGRTNVGRFELRDLSSHSLRILVNAATMEAAKRVRALATTRARSRQRPELRA